MHKYKPIEFQFDLEIKRTIKRLRKDNRDLKSTKDMADLQNIGDLNP